jgi:hypothetical protein
MFERTIRAIVRRDVLTLDAIFGYDPEAALTLPLPKRLSRDLREEATRQVLKFMGELAEDVAMVGVTKSIHRDILRGTTRLMELSQRGQSRIA